MEENQLEHIEINIIINKKMGCGTARGGRLACTEEKQMSSILIRSTKLFKNNPLHKSDYNKYLI